MARGDLATMAPDRRRQLLHLAAREFVGAGYERASLNRIIRACGMSKSSFYHYVDGKQALFDLVVVEATTAMADVLTVPDPAELAADGVDFWTSVAELSEGLVVSGLGEPWFRDFGRLFHLPDVPSGGPLHRATAGIHTWLRRVLEVGRTRSAIRCDLPIALQGSLVIAVLTTMDDWSLAQDDLSAARQRELVRLQVDALRRLLAP